MGVEGLERLSKLIDNFEELSKAPSKLAERLEPVVDGLVREQFITKKDPYGGTWASLAASTIAKKRRGSILIESGNMRDSLTVKAFGGNALAMTMDSPAGHHQYGTQNMPDRPIFPRTGEVPPVWAEEFKKEGAELIRDIVTEGL